jgi:hypothetical protein
MTLVFGNAKLDLPAPTLPHRLRRVTYPVGARIDPPGRVTISP